MSRKNTPKSSAYKARLGPAAPAAPVLQALAQAWGRLPGRGNVWLAVSGGLDSMVLLEGVSRLALGSMEKARVRVVHVNHRLRGPESDGDEKLVQERAQALGIPFVVHRIEWGGERPTQERARGRREALYAQLAAGENDRVWLAHHLNDQAETVFFRILRGTGIDGLAGIRPESGRKWRPFLALEKSQLRAAAEEWKISWREDSSNQDTRYERNWLRQVFLQLEGRRPGFQKRIAALAEEAASLGGCRPLPLFSWSPGVDFLRGRAGWDTRQMKEAYRLGRTHAGHLQRLLERPAGRLEAAGVRFTWSQGILLSERKGARFVPALGWESTGRVSGPLGSWQPLDGQPPCWFLGRGEALKKAFQVLGVPHFFRAGIPVLDFGGRPLPLLPARGALPPGFHFSPSRLGSWWLDGP